MKYYKYCLKLYELGNDARKVDDNVICRECEEEEG